MAKRKHRTKPAIKLDLKTRLKTVSDPCAQRLSNLAIELTFAGGEVLKDHFGFSENQLNEWLDKTLERAKVNRAE